MPVGGPPPVRGVGVGPGAAPSAMAPCAWKSSDSEYRVTYSVEPVVATSKAHSSARSGSDTVPHAVRAAAIWSG